MGAEEGKQRGLCSIGTWNMPSVVHIISSHQFLHFLTTRRLNHDVLGMCPGSNVWKMRRLRRSRLENVHAVVAVAPKASTDLLR